MAVQGTNARDRVQVSNDGYATAEHFELAPKRLEAFRKRADLQARLGHNWAEHCWNRALGIMDHGLQSLDNPAVPPWG